MGIHEVNMADQKYPQLKNMAVFIACSAAVGYLIYSGLSMVSSADAINRAVSGGAGVSAVMYAKHAKLLGDPKLNKYLPETPDLVGAFKNCYWGSAHPVQEPDLPMGVAVTTEQATPATTQTPVTNPVQSGDADKPKCEEAEDNKEESGSKAWVWIIVLLILAGVGVGAYFMFFRKTAGEED